MGEAVACYEHVLNHALLTLGENAGAMSMSAISTSTSTHDDDGRGGGSGGGVEVMMMSRLPGLETLLAARALSRPAAGGQGLGQAPGPAQEQGLAQVEVGTDIQVRAAIDELVALLNTVASANAPATATGQGLGQGEEVTASGRPAKRAKRDNKDNKLSSTVTTTAGSVGGGGGGGGGGEMDVLVNAFHAAVRNAEALWHRSRALFEWQGDDSPCRPLNTYQQSLTIFYHLSFDLSWVINQP